jgi:uncharacterized protein YdeI (YjbR/CyaY-like superfamily)
MQLPPDLQKALNANPKSKIKWEGFTPIARRDFVSWVEGAKQEETRKRRIERTCDMLLSGKRRPCCYAVVPMNLYTALNENSKAKVEWKNLTPDEKRNFIAWIEKEKGYKEKYQNRIEKVCEMLVAGKRAPLS